jgi:hypothetical protein
VTSYRYLTLPTGSVMIIPVEDAPSVFGTYVSPTSFIPFDTPEERERKEAQQREESAGKVRAILSQVSWEGKP